MGLALGQRIGYLLPYDTDKWWVIDEATSLDFLEKEIQECLLHKVIPEIDKCITDNHLLDLWVLNELPGTGIFNRKNVFASEGYKIDLAKL